jgi:hypothetical protein
MKLEPQDKEAKENEEFVRRKIAELKSKPPSSPSSPPSSSPQNVPEPSEAAKRAKAEADKAVLQRKYRNALTIMTNQLDVDPTVGYYADYIQRLRDINGIKKTDNP